MNVNIEPIKAQLAKDIGDYICLHPDDMAALVSEVELLRGERAAVVAWLRANTCGCYDFASAIERGEHRRKEE